MATRATTALEIARNRKTEAAEQMRMHAKLCRTCVSLTETANRYCDQGWQIATAYRRADNDVKTLSAPAPSEQERLF